MIDEKEEHNKDTFESEGETNFMDKEDKFKEKLKTTIEFIDENFVPKHIGNGIYICKEMNLICNKDFLDEVNNAIIEEVKKN